MTVFSLTDKYDTKRLHQIIFPTYTESELTFDLKQQLKT